MLKRTLFALLVAVALLPTLLFAQSTAITTPKQHFGFNIGDNYHLANFTETEQYFKKLEAESPRVQYTVMGQTEEGRDQCMLIVSSPENLQNLEKYRTISTTLAQAQIDEGTARSLADEGKAVVWIDGGLHSTETVAMHQLIELAYQLSSRTDQETMDILDNTIILLVHANPDGQELVSNWYMREPVPENRSLSGVPFLYQKYAGHDNNRDFFMLNLKESQNIARQLFIEWNPQIMYNHHQTAPAGAVVAGAPYRDPFNYVFDPLLMSGIDALGAAMSSRLNAENKPGYTAKGGSVFSTWYNGGLRTTTYFHNMVGLLTEIIGGPNPFEIPLVPDRLIPSSNTQFPVVPQTWYFKNSIDYSISLNYAVLGYASRYRNEVLYNIYRMGRNSIEKGRQDTWSLSPSKVAVIDSAIAQARRDNPETSQQRFAPRETMESLFSDKDYRDPRGYIIPKNQKDIVTTIRFLNALIGNGIAVQVADRDFSINGKSYEEGSYIIKTDQAFRPHILDMFEPQDHPNDFAYPGGPPIPPYDAAGWTLAYLMHVEFDRLLEDFDGPFRTLPLGESIAVQTEPIKSKFLKASSEQNNTFKLVNQVLNKGNKAWRDQSTGDWYMENKIDAGQFIPGLTAVSSLPKNIEAVKPARIALWDTYGGSMPSGWLRLILEQYEYDFTVIYPPQFDLGNLHEQFDVIILPPNAVPRSGSSGFGGRMRSGEAPENIPSPHRENWGRLSVETSVPILKEFVENGGTIVTTGSSAALAQHFGLQVENALVDEEGNPLGRETYYTPGSVLNVSVQENHPATYGYADHIDIYFANNDVFKINDPDITPLLWFGKEDPLRSGWSWGGHYLQDGVIAFEKNIGKGRLTVYNTDITFRAQTQGTFRLLFNRLYP